MRGIAFVFASVPRGIAGYRWVSRCIADVCWDIDLGDGRPHPFQPAGIAFVFAWVSLGIAGYRRVSLGITDVCGDVGLGDGRSYAFQVAGYRFCFCMGIAGYRRVSRGIAGYCRCLCTFNGGEPMVPLYAFSYVLEYFWAMRRHRPCENGLHTRVSQWDRQTFYNTKRRAGTPKAVRGPSCRILRAVRL